jgi:hypothetical protein
MHTSVAKTTTLIHLLITNTNNAKYIILAMHIELQDTIVYSLPLSSLFRVEFLELLFFFFSRSSSIPFL